MEYLRWRFAQLVGLAVSVFVGVRGIRSFRLGDRAVRISDGCPLVLRQGVTSPRWECEDAATGERVSVHETEMRKVATLGNYLASFRSRRRWWMDYWFHVYVGRRMNPRGPASAYYGTHGAMVRRQRRRDRNYVKRYAAAVRPGRDAPNG